MPNNKVDSTDLMNVETIHILNSDFNMYGTIDKPLFLANDVAQMIEYSEDKVGQMLENVDDDEKLTDTIYRAGQQREMWFLTEYGLYELLMQSRKPLAKMFKVEVKKTLHQIRLGEYRAPRTVSDRDNTLMIENAQLIFHNFSGKESKYNAPGDRNFCVVIDDPDMAQKLADDGWNIKPRTSRDDDGDAGSYLPVTVRYDNFPPKIYMISGKVKTLLTEESVGNLDFADIVCADLTINPSKWDDNGRRRIKAYLQTMYVTLRVDKLAAKYAEDEYDDPQS